MNNNRTFDTERPVKQKDFELGRSYWIQYEYLNGYAFSPTREGLGKLAKNLDLTVPHVKKFINIYLQA
jgi:hypothetical protein